MAIRSNRRSITACDTWAVSFMLLLVVVLTGGETIAGVEAAAQVVLEAAPQERMRLGGQGKSAHDHHQHQQHQHRQLHDDTRHTYPDDGVNSTVFTTSLTIRVVAPPASSAPPSIQEMISWASLWAFFASTLGLALYQRQITKQQHQKASLKNGRGGWESRHPSVEGNLNVMNLLLLGTTNSSATPTPMSVGEWTRLRFRGLLTCALATRTLLIPAQIIWSNAHGPLWFQLLADTLPELVFASTWTVLVTFFVQLVTVAVGGPNPTIPSGLDHPQNPNSGSMGQYTPPPPSTNHHQQRSQQLHHAPNKNGTHSVPSPALVLQFIVYIVYFVAIGAYLMDPLASVILVYAFMCCIYAGLFGTVLYFGPRLGMLLYPQLMQQEQQQQQQQHQQGQGQHSSTATLDSAASGNNNDHSIKKPTSAGAVGLRLVICGVLLSLLLGGRTIGLACKIMAPPDQDVPWWWEYGCLECLPSLCCLLLIHPAVANDTDQTPSSSSATATTTSVSSTLPNLSSEQTPLTGSTSYGSQRMW